MATDQPRPRTATGMPRNRDWALVVTRVQSMVPEPAHARIFAVVKCAMVR